jgi:hypothetical protein
LAAVPDRAQAGHSISPACGGSSPCLCPTQLSPHRGRQRSVVVREIYCTSRRRMETPSLPTEGDPSSMRQHGARLPMPRGSDADRAASLPCTATTPPQRTRASRPWAHCPGLIYLQHDALTAPARLLQSRCGRSTAARAQVTEHASYLIMSGSGSRDHGDGGRGRGRNCSAKAPSASGMPSNRPRCNKRHAAGER